MNNAFLKEVIVVEGRDDTCAIKRALDCDTIETHGFGIKKETWELIEKAYNERGIIVFTDPDHAGEAIRKKIIERFPDAKQAFLTRKDAEKSGDIGIENAEPSAILEALSHIHTVLTEKRSEFTALDMANYGLAGGSGAREKRQALGKLLGIGYGNAAAFLSKLNSYGISREDFLKNEALLSGNDKRFKG